MDLKEFYSVCNGNYADAKGRLLSDERILKFVRLFLDDPTYDSLVLAMETLNYPDAFRAAHTLKGLAGNLSFTGLYETSSALTEALRPTDDGNPKDLNAAPQLMLAVRVAYELIITASPLIADE